MLAGQHLVGGRLDGLGLVGCQLPQSGVDRGGRTLDGPHQFASLLQGAAQQRHRLRVGILPCQGGSQHLGASERIVVQESRHRIRVATNLNRFDSRGQAGSGTIGKFTGSESPWIGPEQRLDRRFLRWPDDEKPSPVNRGSHETGHLAPAAQGFLTDAQIRTRQGQLCVEDQGSRVTARCHGFPPRSRDNDRWFLRYSGADPLR